MIQYSKLFFKKQWLAVLVIFLATIFFFWPLLPQLDSYSEGGDAMFNAWTLAFFAKVALIIPMATSIFPIRTACFTQKLSFLPVC
jgi:hypothetical protein